jgi:hypothetical protein
MFAMGLSVAVTRVGEPERTDGLCEIACGAIYIFIGNTSETVFALIL